jgi:hypothetical protein
VLQVAVLLLQRFETAPLQGRGLGVADRILDRSFRVSQQLSVMKTVAQP